MFIGPIKAFGSTNLLANVVAYTEPALTGDGGFKYGSNYLAQSAPRESVLTSDRTLNCKEYSINAVNDRVWKWTLDQRYHIEFLLAIGQGKDDNVTDNPFTQYTGCDVLSNEYFYEMEFRVGITDDVDDAVPCRIL